MSLSAQIQSVQKLRPFLDAARSLLEIAERSESLTVSVDRAKATLDAISKELAAKREQLAEATKSSAHVVEQANLEGVKIITAAKAKAAEIEQQAEKKLAEATTRSEAVKKDLEKFEQLAKGEVDTYKSELVKVKAEIASSEEKLTGIRVAIANANKV